MDIVVKYRQELFSKRVGRCIVLLVGVIIIYQTLFQIYLSKINHLIRVPLLKMRLNFFNFAIIILRFK
jgi:hypothetical protein